MKECHSFCDYCKKEVDEDDLLEIGLVRHDFFMPRKIHQSKEMCVECRKTAEEELIKTFKQVEDMLRWRNE